MSLSHFDEKSGVVICQTSWGCWWQTVFEVHLSLNIPRNTKSKNVTVNIKANEIMCQVHGAKVIEGKLFKTIHPDDSVWTIEDGCILSIVLSKAEYEGKDTLWDSLLVDGGFSPDPITLLEMRKKLDLEKFQLENPGMDFSRAKLSKSYETTPGPVLHQSNEEN